MERLNFSNPEHGDHSRYSRYPFTFRNLYRFGEYWALNPIFLF